MPNVGSKSALTAENAELRWRRADRVEEGFVTVIFDNRRGDMLRLNGPFRSGIEGRGSAADKSRGQRDCGEDEITHRNEVQSKAGHMRVVEKHGGNNLKDVPTWMRCHGTE